MKKLIPILLVLILAVLLVYAVLYSSGDYIEKRAEESFGTMATTEPKSPVSETTEVVTTEPELPDFAADVTYFPKDLDTITPEFLH